jgi:hypothetical protein
MRVALARKLDGIDSVELGEPPDPEPAAEQALVRVHGAGVGLWTLGSSAAASQGSPCRSSQARKSPASPKRPARGPVSSRAYGCTQSYSRPASGGVKRYVNVSPGWTGRCTTSVPSMAAGIRRPCQ